MKSGDARVMIAFLIIRMRCLNEKGTTYVREGVVSSDVLKKIMLRIVYKFSASFEKEKLVFEKKISITRPKNNRKVM